MGLRRNTFAVLLMVLALACPSAAFAQSGQEAYGNSIVAGLEEGPGDPPTTTDKASGALPFTGADLGVLAVAGAGLLALGFGLRRMTHAPDSV